MSKSKKKPVETIKKRMDCGYEEDNTKCPIYTKPEYERATYCIYASWEGSCLNHKKVAR